MKKERVLNKKGNLNPVQGAPHLAEGKDHQKKVGVIIIVAVLAVGLLLILLLLGPKLFVGKAINYNLAGLNIREAGIPPQEGTIAPGDLLSIPIAVNVGTSNGNVFEFTLYYDPTELTFTEFVSHSEIIIVEMIPFSPDGETTWELKIVGTVQPPLGYQDVDNLGVDNSGVVEFGKAEFTVNDDIDTSSLSIGFYLFNVLDESNDNIVTEFFGAVFELATVCGNGIVEVGEECDGTNLNDNSCLTYASSSAFTGGTLACTNCVFDTSSCTSGETTVGGLLGDVNGDETVNTGDAIQILRYTVGLRSFTPVQIGIADVTCDDSVNTGDAIQILRLSVGLRSGFTACL